MIKVGRYTAALLLVTVGVLLLADQSLNIHYLGYVLDFWPVLLIAIGLEYMLFTTIARKGDKALKLDVGSLVIAILVSAAVIAANGVSKLPGNWLNQINLNWNGFGFNIAGESGYQFDKDVTRAPLPAGTANIVIDNPNGNVTVKKGSVSQIEIETVVYVDQVDQSEAARIAEQSNIEVSAGHTLTISAQGQEYKGGLIGNRMPRMNLTVTVPDNAAADMDVRLRNGKLDAVQVPVRSLFKASTSNGSISVSDIVGKVELESANGSVTATNIGGEAKLETSNGKIAASSIKGNVKAQTRNGEIIVKAAEGIDAETNNGHIRAELAAGGDYDIDAKVDMGSVSSDFPVETTKRSASGKIGSGQHPVKLRSNNGSIEIVKLAP